jgi:hypothetical protein
MKQTLKVSHSFVEGEISRPLEYEEEKDFEVRHPNKHIPIEPFEEEKVPNTIHNSNSLSQLNRQLENVNESASAFVIEEDESHSK